MCVDATIPQKQADQNCQPEAESLFEVTFFHWRTTVLLLRHG